MVLEVLGGYRGTGGYWGEQKGRGTEDTVGYILGICKKVGGISGHCRVLRSTSRYSGYYKVL